MDGAPYLRKVDLKLYKSYQELSDALGKMFSSFTIGNYLAIPLNIWISLWLIKQQGDIHFIKFLSIYLIYIFFYQWLKTKDAWWILVLIEGNCGSQGMKDFMNESKLIDLLNGSEYVPTYEDKDGDWMLVGDVPWE